MRMNATHSSRIVPVILSGGNGSRLWPMSREDHPKQFYGLHGSDQSLMQETIARVSDPAQFYPPIVIGNQRHRFLIAEQLKSYRHGQPNIIIEPCVRNTAPAITAAALHIQQQYGDALMLVLPTDQNILDCGAFSTGIEQAAQAAASGHLVTFGIKPEYPETGYGYIKRGTPLSDHAYTVDTFVEKPTAEVAERYIETGEYYWNSGMFMFSTKTYMEEMRRLNPEIVRLCTQAVARSVQDIGFMRLEEVSFAGAENISIDYALMERTARAALIPLDCGWSDTGTWESLWRISPKDEQGNVALGECYPLESRDCYMRSENGPAIATYGVDNLVIVATKDAVVVADKNNAQALKKLSEHVRRSNTKIVSENHQVYRPWGMYESINHGPRYQVKHIHVKPGEKLSLQMHYHRAEHWIVVSGTAKVTCGDKEHLLTENQSIYIPNGCMHRIENPGKINLEIIEVQSGAYLGEDDIVRFEDQYGRTDTHTVQDEADTETGQEERKVSAA